MTTGLKDIVDVRICHLHNNFKKENEEIENVT